MSVERLFLLGLVAHLVGDFFLQNAWMARHKADPRHPAAWIHALVHWNLLLYVWAMYGGFPTDQLVLAAGSFVTVTHALIDTRAPLRWWRWVTQQSTDGEGGAAFAFAQDQASHLLVLLGVCFLVGR